MAGMPLFVGNKAVEEGNRVTDVVLHAGLVIAGRYRVAAPIGRGGMGTVYAAEDLRLGGKLRALKLLSGAAADGRALAAEAEMLMELRHPHLPQIVDYIPADGDVPAALVTDYVEGVTLRGFVESAGGPLPVREAVRIADQLADALAYLHARRPPVVHRDLKPSNVMLAPSGFASLIDFGIARRIRADSDTRQLGTPGFAAPEQFGPGGRSDERSDQYAFGALMFYMLSGGATYDPEKHEDRPIPQCPRLPRGLRQAVGTMLAQNPAKRFPSVAAAMEALRAAAPAAAAEAAPGFPRAPGSAKRTIAVASISPGSGGTFVAITLAKLLAGRGEPAAYVEHFAVLPEAFGLLPGDWTQAGDLTPYGDGYLCRRDPGSGALLLALPPEERWRAADPAQKHRLMCRSLDAGTVVHDLSGAWEGEGIRELAEECELLLLAGDPCPSKWSASRLSMLRRLAESRRQAGRATCWIANKDMAFRGRKEWLSMFPGRPAAVVPLLPPAEWTDWLWRGRWATEHPVWGPRLADALKPALPAWADWQSPPAR